MREDGFDKDILDEAEEDADVDVFYMEGVFSALAL